MKIESNRKYNIILVVEASNPFEAKKAIESLGLKVSDVTLVDNKRTDNQNNALHLLFSQLAGEMLSKGITMKDVLKEGFEFPPTPYAIKEFIWKKAQKYVLGKNSTTKLKKTEDIEQVYDVVNNLLIDRTNGQISLPPFPSLETLIKK